MSDTTQTNLPPSQPNNNTQTSPTHQAQTIRQDSGYDINAQHNYTNFADVSNKINSTFVQQHMKSYQPLLNPLPVILVFICMGIAFIPIGASILVAVHKIHSYTVRYDNLVPSTCTVQQQNFKQQQDTCLTQVSMYVDKHMTGPVYLYYYMTNYWQNHRKYEQSVSQAQLADVLSSVTISDCNPLASYQSQYIYPCGLTANTFFNDTYSAAVQQPNTNTYTFLGGPQSPPDQATWQKDGIAWSTDIHTKYVPLTRQQIQQQNYIQKGPNTPPGQQLPSVQDQDWMVWMRVNAFPNFHKIYRIINTDIPAGSTIHFNITNTYPVSAWSGTKSLVLMQQSWIGGPKSVFLGWFYIAAGILCILLSIIYFIHIKLNPRDIHDTKYLNLDI